MLKSKHTFILFIANLAIMLVCKNEAHAAQNLLDILNTNNMKCPKYNGMPGFDINKVKIDQMKHEFGQLRV